MARTETRRAKLDLRLTPSAKTKLQMAAANMHRSVSDFVLESALAKADETLPDRQRFVLSPEKWEKFLAALDADLPPSPRFDRLLGEPSVFERSKKS